MKVGLCLDRAGHSQVVLINYCGYMYIIIKHTVVVQWGKFFPFRALICFNILICQMSKIKKCDLNFIRFENSGECKDCFFLEEFVSATI